MALSTLYFLPRHPDFPHQVRVPNRGDDAKEWLYENRIAFGLFSNVLGSVDLYDVIVANKVIIKPNRAQEESAIFYFKDPDLAMRFKLTWS